MLLAVINFAGEVASRTEQYWCLIKHAHKIIDAHHRYTDFIDYGNAEDYQKNMIEIRNKLQNE